jgi:hypothetical protein
MLWEKSGPVNTDRTVKAAITRAKELGIKYMVVASTTGLTASKFPANEFMLICVSHHIGFGGPGGDEMGAGVREELQGQGIKVLTTTHLFAGVDRALRLKFQGLYPAEIMANTLRIFGQGVKVGVEIACMALDAGLIPYGKEVVAVGGTDHGADTAIVVVPAHSNNFFDTKVKEIICMPREK